MRRFTAIFVVLSAGALAQSSMPASQSNAAPAGPSTTAPLYPPMTAGPADAGGDSSTFSGAGSTLSTGPQVGDGSTIGAGPQVGPPDISEPADAGVRY